MDDESFLNQCDILKENISTLKQDLDAFRKDGREPTDDSVKVAKQKIKLFDILIEEVNTSERKSVLEGVGADIFEIREILSDTGKIVGGDQYDDRTDEILNRLNAIKVDLYDVTTGDISGDNAVKVINLAKDKIRLYESLVSDLEDNELWIEELDSLCDRNINQIRKYLNELQLEN